MTEPRARKLGVTHAVGLGFNGIVGSGIYLLVAPLAAVGGRESPWGVLLCAALCGTIALCFAELASATERSGGPAAYARAAFGALPGFAVGWLGMATGVLGLSAVARGLSQALVALLGARALSPGLLAALLVAVLGLINWWGVRAGGRTSSALAALKLAPLLLLGGAGLWVALRSPPLAGQPLGSAPGSALRHVVDSAFLALFMLSGFEYASVPAAEVESPRRNVPIAVLASLGAASLLYLSLQAAAVRLLPDVATASQPLPELGAKLFGPWAFAAIAATALISMMGFCASVALVAPRYLQALAEGGELPAALARSGPRGTPGWAIGATTALAVALVAVLGYAQLVDAANVVILSGYALTCLACLTLRLRQPELPRAVKLPGGVAIPALAALSSLTLLWAAHPAGAQWRLSGGLLALGLLSRAAMFWAGRRGATRGHQPAQGSARSHPGPRGSL